MKIIIPISNGKHQIIITCQNIHGSDRQLDKLLEYMNINFILAKEFNSTINFLHHIIKKTQHGNFESSVEKTPTHADNYS